MPKKIAKRTPNKSDDVRAKAVLDYQNNALTTTEIATKHDVSPATITVWAKQAGLKLRPRGRWEQDVPTARQAEILKMVAVYTYEQVGRHFGMHKQSIHRIVKRWKTRQEPRSAPFQPGDEFTWRGKTLTVVDATPDSGTVIDKNGKLYKNFTWSTGRIPKKTGVNPAYTVAVHGLQTPG